MIAISVLFSVIYSCPQLSSSSPRSFTDDVISDMVIGQTAVSGDNQLPAVALLKTAEPWSTIAV